MTVLADIKIVEAFVMREYEIRKQYMIARYIFPSKPIMLLVILMAVIASSCNSGKYLTEGDTLLEENNLNFKTNERVDNLSLLKSELNSFIIQEPNGRWLWIPEEWIYMVNDDTDDNKWYNNFARKYLGAPPTIYNHQATEQAAYNMQQYLRNKKGFYDAQVTIDTSHNSYKTYVDYDIDAHTRYTINSLTYFGKDTALVDVIKSIKSGSLVQVGDPLDATVFDLEKTRIVNRLKNMGYANFASNYIDIKGDSTGLDYKVDIFMEIYPPGPGTYHKQYTVGEVNVYTDYFRGTDSSKLYSEKIGKYTYLGKSKDFLVNPSALSYKIFLTPGETVKQDERLKTFKSLSSLGTYRFVSMNPRADVEQDTVINFDIYLTAHQKKWIADYGSDLFYSTISAANKNIFGYSLSSTFANRNTFGGSEKYSIGLEFGQELELNPLQSRTTSISVQQSLTIPREVNLLGMSTMLRALRLVSADAQRSFKEQAQTNINAGIRIQRIREFYDEQDIGVSFGYTYAPDNRRRYAIRQVAFNLNLSTLKEKFLDQIGDNPAIINSFEDYLTTGLLIRDVNFSYSSRINPRGFSWALISSFGQSGFETWAANNIYNALSDSDSEWNIPGSTPTSGVNFAKFVKMSLDFRGYKATGEKSSLASRLYMGIIQPFGGDEIVPFKEQYGVGGPNSLRGWEQLEIGPGGYFDENQDPDQLFYQKGDLRLEFNLEYRFDIFKIPGVGGRLEGALFTDAGNVWLLTKDPLRPNAEIGSRFYNQIAVAGGWGLRFDFQYFIIRFDFGYKVRNSYENKYGNHWQSLSQIRKQGTLGFGNLQVGVNYAF